MKRIQNIFDRVFGKKKSSKTAKTVQSNDSNRKTVNDQRNNVTNKKIQNNTKKVPKTAIDPKKRIRKTKSLESVFSVKPKAQDMSTSRLTSMNGTPSGTNVFDVCAYVIYCPKHKRVALSREEKTGYLWLPFVGLPDSRTWGDGSIAGANIILANGDAATYLRITSRPVISSAHCMHVFRLQLPQTQKFIVRLIYFIKLVETNDSFKCCTKTKRIEWLSRDDIIANKVTNLWGPEVVQFIKYSSGPTIVQKIDEYSLDQAFFYVPRDPPRNLEEELLKSTNYTEKDVERIYGDYVEHCFPAFYMTLTSFSDYMSKYGFEKRDKKILLLFKAFNFNNSGFLSFSEFLIGLTSIEPNAYNGQSRIKFVFKYFDVDRDGYLNDQEFEQMVREIYTKESDIQIKKRIEANKKRIGFSKDGISFDQFFTACGTHRFRGTSSLCRSNRSIVSQISREIANRTIRRGTKQGLGVGSILMDRKYKGICMSCKEKRYDYSIHTLRLDREGHCVDARPLPEWDKIERSEKLSKNKSAEEIRRQSSINITNISRERFSRDFVWNPKSVANFFIQQIRAFNLKKGSHKDNRGLMDSSPERPVLLKRLQDLCSEMERILGQEERCIQMISPAVVVGDIHGNIEDLLTMERVLWKSIPIIATNLVFLGDYVDRGKWGFECAVYIMCLKLLAPNKVVILRGNHEVRDLQIHYTYKTECLNKYGDKIGAQVFELTNRVFDRLPVSAVIDEAIFLAHGGIPCSTRQIQQINEIKTELKDPERESAIVWEILWSDPIDSQKFEETAELLNIRVESARGFLTNTKRGTAFLFSEEAANNFLQNNGLTHIVRAHEVPAHGYTFHFGKKCLTIFSSSHYCGNNNSAACVHIDSEKIRIIRLDTVNNAPASE